MKHEHIASIGALLCATLAGCASASIPAERLASSEAAIRGAEETGGGANPQGALHLKLARDQVDRAKGLIKDGETERADMLLARAEVDAELALALAREAVARSEAEAVSAQIHALRNH